MKQIKIQIQVTLLTICIAIVVVGSGYLAYQSLSEIVGSIHKEARPDQKLLLIKDIATDLNEVENTIRLYSLSGDPAFLKPYRQLDTTIQAKLKTLAEGYEINSREEIIQIDSISLLANRKLLIWDEIRALHRSRKDPGKTFSQLYTKIDTAIIRPDTIKFKPEEKKGFFKRLFGRKDTAVRAPIVIDKAREKEMIKKEIAGIERQIASQSRRLATRETALLEQNIEVTQTLNRQIARLEASEQQQLEIKTGEADFLAAQTFRRMAIFTIAAVILLMIILILFFQNLKKNRQYQQFLRKAKAEAESLAKAKETFVATVSHEMRTPINAIYGLTNQMLRKTSTEEITTELKVVHQSAGHLIALVNDTLDFSKIESQKLKLEQVSFLPGEILGELQILHKDLAREKGIELIIENKTDHELVLQGDPIRLKQILINLITNAIKFTERGKVILSVSAEDTPEQNYLLKMEVADTGIGIAKENLPAIFEEFVQLDTGLTQKQRGAGLGLSIVKKLVLLQNGSIDVESELGKGTRFKLQIPYLKGDATALAPTMHSVPITPEWYKNLRFLIVDDEEYNLHLVRNILKGWGVSFAEARNGKEAVELVAQNSFDLILMDIRMPVMDGYHASRLILQQRPSAKVVALTATSRPTDIQEIEKSGMCAYLQKPFNESELIGIIQKFVPERNIGQSAENAETSTFNLDELERMSGGDLAFRNEMLQIFIRSADDSLSKFRRFQQNHDWQAVAETAHKLAAPARHLQAASLYRQLKKLESMPENSSHEEFGILISAIETETQQIIRTLKQKLENGN